MHVKKVKIPPAFLESLRRPFTDAESSTRVPSQLENLRHKLTAYYRQADEKSQVQQQDAIHYWEQSGSVMRWIGGHVANSKVYTHQKSSIPRAQYFRQLVASKVNRLMKNEPLAYVLGTQPFGPLEIKCEKPILIPRPETEYIFENLCQLLVKHYPDTKIRRPLKILDLCTGTGCIALLLQHRLDEKKIRAKITAIDSSRDAVTLALSNRAAMNNLRFNADASPEDTALNTPSDRLNEIYKNQSDYATLSIQQADVFDDYSMDHLISRDGPFDVIASNPPYVTAEEWKTLEKSVRNWEDPDALIGDVDGASDGLAFYRRIALLIQKGGLLSPTSASSKMPNLLVEVGHKQAKAVQDIFTATGRFSKTSLIEDPWHHERGVMAWCRPR